MRKPVFMLLAFMAFSAASAQQLSVPPSETLQMRRDIVASLAAVLEERFLFPEVGARYAAMLRSKATAGGYDLLADDQTFSDQVIEDLQAIHADAHLRLIPPRPPQTGLSGGTPGRPSPPEAVERLARLTPDIAYLRFGFMSPDPAIAAQVGSFLEANADAETIIFDLRTNIGGTPAVMETALPYFFDRSVEVGNVEVRAGIGPAPSSRDVKRIDAPQGMIRTVRVVTPSQETRLRDAKVYILTSTRSASAAEGFAFAFQQTGRARIVGEASYGAGHFGSIVPIAAGFSAFVPFGRPYDPKTGKGWEGDGVVPDIRVPAENALVAALLEAGVPDQEARTLAASIDPDISRMKPQRPPKRLS